ASHQSYRVLVQRGCANHSKQRSLGQAVCRFRIDPLGAVRARALLSSTCQPFFAGDECHPPALLAHGTLEGTIAPYHHRTDALPEDPGKARDKRQNERGRRGKLRTAQARLLLL
ncbi:unnamed protein product, partial [Ectocarpus sp. 8 AP-2014]